MPPKPSIHTMLQTAVSQLKSDEAKLEAQLLLQHLLHVNRAWLIAHQHDVVDDKVLADFEALLRRRIVGEPIAYILGRREFYGLDLFVTPDTLIPRPDTETLVETALARIQNNANQTIVDLGTGTGAIALAIAKHRPQALVIAVDISKAALNIANKNADNLQITNVQFVLSHWFDELSQRRFDVIVSNPPYIEENDAHLSQGDLRFEPKSALTSGEDGLNDIRMIIENSLVHLQPQGWLMLEHGFNQAEKVADLMSNAGLVSIETFKDFGGNNRVTIGKNPLIINEHWAT